MTTLDINGWVWDIGDINNNGLTDIIVQHGDEGPFGSGYLQIWESQYPNTFPTELLNSVELEDKKGFYYAKYQDLDNDGKNEVIICANSYLPNTWSNSIQVYEWEDDELEYVWGSDPYFYVLFDQAIGDFDMDGNIEIVIAQQGSNNSFADVYECTGDNSFQFEQTFNLPEQGIPRPSRINFDRGRPELSFGINYTEATESKINYYFYKNQTNNYSLYYNTDYPPIQGYPPFITNVAGDLDCDIYEEFFVFAKPYISTIEFFEYDMQTSWTIESNTKLISAYDLNNNGRLNLIEYYLGGDEELILKIYEDSRPLIKENITTPTTWTEDIVIIDEIDVDNNLQVSPGVNVFISYGGKLNISPTGSFNLNDNSTVYGYLTNNLIHVEGLISTGNDVKFTVEDHFEWKGIDQDNTANDYIFTNKYRF